MIHQGSELPVSVVVHYQIQQCATYIVKIFKVYCLSKQWLNVETIKLNLQSYCLYFAYKVYLLVVTKIISQVVSFSKLQYLLQVLLTYKSIKIVLIKTYKLKLSKYNGKLLKFINYVLNALLSSDSYIQFKLMYAQ